MGKNRDGGERRAATDPAEKDAHLQLADIELQSARETRVALFRGQHDDIQPDAFGLHRAVDEKARPVVIVAR